MAKNKNQHYTPKCYLSQFVDTSACWYPTTKAVWLFDKTTSVNAKLKGIANVCSNQYFYSNINSAGTHDHEIENWLAEQETKLGELLKRIETKSPDQIYHCLDKSPEDRNTINEFALIQMLRVPKYLSKLAPLLGIDYDPANSQSLPEEWKAPIFKSLFLNQSQSYRNLLDLIRAKLITIQAIDASCTSRFNSSDNPIMVTNPIFRNAIANPLTEISFPLNPRIAISLHYMPQQPKISFIAENLIVQNYNASIFRNCARFVIGSIESDMPNNLGTL